MLVEIDFNIFFFFESSHPLLRIQGCLQKVHEDDFFQKTWFDLALTLRERRNKMSKVERPCVPKRLHLLIGDAFSAPLQISLTCPSLQLQL